MKKPLLATGKLGGDYQLIITYWQTAGGAGSEKAEKIVLNRDDFKRAEKILEKISGRKTRVSELIEDFSSFFKDRIDPELAEEAYLKAHGVRISGKEAAKKVCEALAIWLLEALESEGKISLVD